MGHKGVNDTQTLLQINVLNIPGPKPSMTTENPRNQLKLTISLKTCSN